MVTHLQFPFHFWSSWHCSPRCQKPSCPVLAGLLLFLRCVHAPAGCNSLVELVKLASVDMRLWFWRGSEVTPHPLLGACGGNRFMWGGNDLLLALNWSAVNAAPQVVVLVRRKSPQMHCAVAAPGEKSRGNSRSYVLLTATGLPPPKGIAQIPVDIWKAQEGPQVNSPAKALPCIPGSLCCAHTQKGRWLLLLHCVCCSS